jgi:DNA-binding LacI/PurR family transcriptional regulator
MADVARDAGVSVMTVSYVFSRPERVSPGVRELVVQAALRLNYHGPDPAARSLARGRSNSVGVVVGEGLSYAFDDFPSTRFLVGVAAVCVEYRQNLVLIPAAGDAGDVSRVREAAVDSYILWTGVRDGPVLDAVIGSGKPAAIQGPPPDSLRLRPGPGRVSAAARPGGRQIQVVTADDRSAASAVVSATFAGARAPAVVSFALSPEGSPRIVRGPSVSRVAFAVARERLRGIQQQCRRMGIPWSGVRVAVVARNNRQDARPLLEELVEDPSPPDAIVAMSDELALGVLDAASQRGYRVPADVTVSGWDNSPAAERHDLTSVHQSLEEQGMRCALFVLGRERQPENSTWRLVERGSTRRRLALQDGLAAGSREAARRGPQAGGGGRSWAAPRADGPGGAG